jgi:hypothetical protein
MKSTTSWLRAIFQLARRWWYIIIPALLIVHVIVLFPKFEHLVRPIRSSYVPPYTPPRPLPFTNVKYSTNNGIPQIIHQSWKNDVVPEMFKTWQQRWKDLHPNYQYHLWTDEDNRELVKQHFPWFLITYDAFPKGVMRADSVRYMYMYHYGGVYADLDMEPLKSSDKLVEFLQIKENQPTAILGHMSDRYIYAHNVPNAWMMSSPGHAFWLFCLMTIIENNIYGENKAEHLTGPVMLYNAAKSYAEATKRITGLHEKGVEQGGTKIRDLVVLRPGLIYPYDWSASEKYIDVCGAKEAIKDSSTCTKNFPDAFTITYWTHSWE